MYLKKFKNYSVFDLALYLEYHSFTYNFVIFLICSAVLACRSSYSILISHDCLSFFDWFVIGIFAVHAYYALMSLAAEKELEYRFQSLEMDSNE